MTATRLSLLLFLLFPVALHAGISRPDSSVAISKDGTKILVMLSLWPKYDMNPCATLPDGRTVNLHNAFTSSGVYDAKTLKPIWQVHWFAFQYELLWSDDFRYIVRLNRQGFRPNSWALSFYDDGRLIRQYDCPHLLPTFDSMYCLPYETWDWYVRWFEDFSLDSDGRTVHLSTPRRRIYVHITDNWTYINLGVQDFYTFDLTTGATLTQKTIGAWRPWADLATTLTPIILLIFAARFLFRRCKGLMNRRGFPVITSADQPTSPSSGEEREKETVPLAIATALTGSSSPVNPGGPSHERNCV